MVEIKEAFFNKFASLFVAVDAFADCACVQVQQVACQDDCGRLLWRLQGRFVFLSFFLAPLTVWSILQKCLIALVGQS